MDEREKTRLLSRSYSDILRDKKTPAEGRGPFIKREMKGYSLSVIYFPLRGSVPQMSL